MSFPFLIDEHRPGLFYRSPAIVDNGVEAMRAEFDLVAGPLGVHADSNVELKVEMSTQEQQLTREILRLLLQVAWADGQLDTAEVTNVLNFARNGGLEEIEIDTIQSTLRGGQPLPAPDFGFLRSHGEVAMSAARTLMAADGQVSEDEQEMLSEIEALLAMP